MLEGSDRRLVKVRRILLFTTLFALFLFPPSPFPTPLHGVMQTSAPSSPSSSLPKLPRSQKWDWNLLSDFYKWLNKLPESAVRYGYWLPSNMPDMIPNVYASGNNFGITSTGSTSYPTSTQTTGGAGTNSVYGGYVDATEFTAAATGTITQVGIDWTNTVVSNFVVGVYSDAGGSPDRPGTVLGSSASTVASGTGFQDVALTGSVYVVSGAKYWMAISCSAARYVNSGNSGDLDRYFAYTYDGTLPAWSSSDTLVAKATHKRITYVQIEGYTKGTRVQYSGSTCSSCVSSFSFYVTNYSSGDKIVLALYSDSSGSPSQELWNSNLSGTDPGATGWAVIQESSGTVNNSWNVGLTSDSYYWFMWQWNSTDSGPSYAAGSSGTGVYLAESFGTLLSTFSGGTLTAEDWSEYASYTTGPPAPGSYAVNVHAGATQVVVTVTWTGSGTCSVTLVGPGTPGTPMLSESGETVYDRLTYTSGSTTPTNIHRVTFNISSYSPSTAQAWTVYVSLSASYTVTTEVS